MRWTNEELQRKKLRQKGGGVQGEKGRGEINGGGGGGDKVEREEGGSIEGEEEGAREDRRGRRSNMGENVNEEVLQIAPIGAQKLPALQEIMTGRLTNQQSTNTTTK